MVARAQGYRSQLAAPLIVGNQAIGAPSIICREIRQLVNDVVDLMADAARRKLLLLTASVDPAIPAHVRGDPGRLRQILTNLVSNAFEFTEHDIVAMRNGLP